MEDQYFTEPWVFTRVNQRSGIFTDAVISNLLLMLSAPIEAATAMGQLIGAKIVHTFMSIRAFMSLLSIKLMNSSEGSNEGLK